MGIYEIMILFVLFPISLYFVIVDAKINREHNASFKMEHNVLFPVYAGIYAGIVYALFSISLSFIPLLIIGTLFVIVRNKHKSNKTIIDLTK